MWGAITGFIFLIYIAIFSLLKSASQGEKESQQHRIDLIASKEEILSNEKNENHEN